MSWRRRDLSSPGRDRLDAGVQQLRQAGRRALTEPLDDPPKEARTRCLSPEIAVWIRILGREQVALGVGHESQDPASPVGEAGGVSNAAVGVIRVDGHASGPAGIYQYDPSDAAQRGDAVLPALDEDLSLAVCHREVELRVRIHKRAVRLFRPAPNPAVFVPASVVVGKGDANGAVGTGHEVHSHEHLEPVADSKYATATVDKPPQGVADMMNELVGENLSTGDVIAVGEASGDGQDLIVIKSVRGLNEPADVQSLRHRAGAFPREGGFLVAVDSRRAKNKDTRLAHER